MREIIENNCSASRANCFSKNYSICNDNDLIGLYFKTENDLFNPNDSISEISQFWMHLSSVNVVYEMNQLAISFRLSSLLKHSIYLDAKNSYVIRS